ncbi:MAG: MBL fold metallo-hydrolase [Clostridiales bacterium]|nr:MBL fold metallo-hydrolase [Clostridiales bacterium]
MKINYHGHACFSVELSNGATLLIDPYNDSVGYPVKDRKADVVVCSHNHGDHNYVENLPAGFTLAQGVEAAKVCGFGLKGVETYHDGNGGSERGKNIVRCIDADGVRIVHLGDLGHKLSDEQVAAIGKCHVLMVPVGGYYTIDAETAAEVTEQLRPTVAIPMHYRTKESSSLPIATQEAYMELMRQNEYAVSEYSSATLELNPEDLPRAKRVLLMEYK